MLPAGLRVCTTYREFKEYPEGEIVEMVDLYESKGMTREDADVVIRRMAKYPEFFVDIMMVEELELQVPGEDDNPWKDGFITFAAFTVFGIIPLLGYIAFAGSDISDNTLFIIACVLTAIMLFTLGALKSTLTNQKWWASGLEILVMGSITAGIAYLIGFIVEEIMAANGHEVSC